MQRVTRAAALFVGLVDCGEATAPAGTNPDLIANLPDPEVDSERVRTGLPVPLGEFLAPHRRD